MLYVEALPRPCFNWGCVKIVLIPPRLPTFITVHLRPKDVGGLLSCQRRVGGTLTQPRECRRQSSSLAGALRPSRYVLRAVENQRCPVRFQGRRHHRVKQHLPHQLLVAWAQKAEETKPLISPVIMNTAHLPFGGTLNFREQDVPYKRMCGVRKTTYMSLRKSPHLFQPSCPQPQTTCE